MNGAAFTRGDIRSVFTQCTKCETVFRLSAEVLRAAGGQVRCGKCQEVFNALAHLAEDPSVFTAGETSLDLETRADSILESPAPPAPRRAPASMDEPASPGVEIARLQILDWNESDASDPPLPAEEAADDVGETSLEFTLPPGELDRIFVETKKGARPRVPPAPPVAAPAEPEEIEIFSAAAPEPALPDIAAAESAAAPAPTPAPTPSGFEVPEEVRREMLSVVESPEADLVEFARPGRHVRRRGRSSPFGAAPAEADRLSVPWLSAAIGAALLLLVQIVHQNRDWLAAHAPLGGSLRALYSTMGAPVTPPANLSAYQLRQWGVTGDPAGAGTLRVRASILNTAAQLEPYPLLRVTLANRFGGSIGTRDFEPTEYLGKPTAKLLAPGERADATLDILDPGKSAEGFEIDVCLRASDRRVACANDRDPSEKAAAQAKR
ncbi:MAG TPA: zinc-ribbon and DUF3426 domain-containing protein [Steroidobacteraceae bacterium]|nr:zinc-ribbon and DUF3426 domain-containing protein [Steroidobacteraceae bacterium]